MVLIPNPGEQNWLELGLGILVMLLGKGWRRLRLGSREREPRHTEIAARLHTRKFQFWLWIRRR